MKLKPWVTRTLVLIPILLFVVWFGRWWIGCCNDYDRQVQRENAEREAYAEKTKKACLPYELIKVIELDKKVFTVCRSDKTETGLAIIEVKF
jgi:hypothetical protein